VREWLHDGENGYLVPWMDTSVYAEKIDTLLADKQLARSMGERGFERFERDFDFDDYISRLEEILAGIAFDRSRKIA
jgi:glycosyltransferase involved in cell wall biosynthesis